jgi:bifunctional enzyme CysN/CysC
MDDNQPRILNAPETSADAPQAPGNGSASRQQLHIVIVGHVDHGKSTVIGRLLADTGSLPEGKLDQVRAMCARNARPFEYAFLLDALKNEQAQGITIDTARCFFKTARRDYILNDAPGHIEFLKNMVTGAARAEAALLVIDANEGIQENSKRHGYMASMLGIKQVAVLVNKMDLVDYSEDVFRYIREEYLAFLSRLGVEPVAFIPISAREGINMTAVSPETPWYGGPSVLEQIDAFTPASDRRGKPFRMPVQDIYKFTAEGDDRRIVVGTVSSNLPRN